VELIDDETLSQSRHFMLKPLTVVLIGTLMFIGMVGGTLALFVYTPAVHGLIPGYKDPDEVKRKEEELVRQLAVLEENVERWSTYAESFKRMAGVGEDSLPTFDPQVADSMRQEIENAYPDVERDPVPPVSTPPPVQQADNTVEPEQISGPPVEFAVQKSPSLRRMNSPAVLESLQAPIIGEIRNGFGIDRKHYGVDIVADENTMINAVADGYVILSEFSDDNGWVIGIASADQVITFYKHNSRLLLEAGTYVRAGTPIAVIGNTGENSNGPHLHLELWYRGMPLDPLDFIPLKP
ncbi:MAG: M23 family metallopeptidase, partial [Bacteroidota bacterium]